MVYSSRQQLSPLPLLKLLEWTLLAIVTVVVVLSAGVEGGKLSFALLLFNLLGVVIMASLGWVSPRRYLNKYLYTAIEFSVILLLVLIGKLPLFALLLLVLAIRNYLILDGRSRSIVTGLVFLIYVVCYTYRSIHQDFPIRVYEEQLLPLWFGSIVSFGLTILFLQLLVNAITTERQIREELAVANNRLQEYASRIEELATLQERNRVAREIHDSLGHTLGVSNFYLEAALRLLHRDLPEAEELLGEVKRLKADALRQVNQSVSSLYTNPLAGQPLSAVIANLVVEFQQTTGIMPHWEITTEPNLAVRYKTAIYRIVQESLTNMRKYAEMTQASIHIEQSLDSIKILVSDNGRGFELHKDTTGFGLRGMRERVLLLSGQLEITTAPDRGCQILVVFPIEYFGK